MRVLGIGVVLSLTVVLVEPVEAAPFKRTSVYIPDAPTEKQVAHSTPATKQRDRSASGGTRNPDTSETLPAASATTVAIPTSTSDAGTLRAAPKTPVKLGFNSAAISRSAKATAHLDAQSPSPSSGIASSSAAGKPAVQVQMLGAQASAKAGISGVGFVLRESGVDSGTTQVSLDYGSFEHAVGADWATRLRLVSYPSCVLTTPTKAACATGTPLKTQQDYQGHTLAAAVNLPTTAATSSATSASPAAAAQPMVLAAEAAPSGSNGDFTATSLKPSGSWTMAGATGGFSWSYPIEMPPAGTGGDVAPDLSLGYSTDAVDGVNVESNPQASWVGQGWSLEGGYVERTYNSCGEDKSRPDNEQTGDMCWAGPIVTLHMPSGETTSLVKDDDTGTWHAQSETGMRIELKSGDGGADNGAWHGEYWLVTDRTGIQYTFGRDLLPGGTDATRTNSVLTEPVFSPDAGDPCHDETDERCTMAYRWNLDMVADRQGNATVYDYSKYTNYYESYYHAASVDDGTRRVYDRDAVLKDIRYGLRTDALNAEAPQQVDFTTDERCFSTADFNCDTADNFTLANAAHWPDVPVDQACKSDGDCDNTAPTFWSRKRLSAITTSYLTTGGVKQKVDSYALGQSFFADTDGELILDSITRTGWHGTDSITTPQVRFAMTAKANRVEGLHGLPAMARTRLHAIYTETGQDIVITYEGDNGQDDLAKPLCTASTIPDSPASNTTECYPVRWTPPGLDELLDYFHKYVVTQVAVEDHNGTAPARITTYTYKGNPAWHYDDNEVQKPKYRTWAQFRGYAEVDSRAGNNNAASPSGPDDWTLTKTFYYRGMDNDRTTADGTGRRDITLTDSQGGTHTDANSYAGQPMETQEYNGSGPDGTAQGSLIQTTISQPKTVATTATRARSGLDALKAVNVQPGGSKTYQPYIATDGTTAYLTSGTATTYDSQGRALEVTTSASGASANCVKTDYADNDSTGVHDLADEVITYETTCPTDTSPNPKIKRAVRTYYDDSTTLGTVTDGQPTRTLTASSLTSTGDPDWSTATESTTGYDAYGRVHTATTEGRTTTTTYTPSGTGATTHVDTQLPLAVQHTSEDIDPGRGITTKSTAVDGLVTEGTFDALGRLTAVWRPGQVKGTDQATETYAYKVGPDAPLAVTTQTLLDRGHGYAKTYQTRIVIYDAFGDIRQAQTDAATATLGTDGTRGRVITDNFTDSHGWTVKSYDHWYTTGTPTTSIVTTPQANIDDWETTAYDGAGRATAVTSHKTGDTETSPGTGTVRTYYSGNAVTVINPTGGISTTTISDGRGDKTEQRNYKTLPTIAGSRVDGYTITGGTYQKLTYGYDGVGQQTTQTTGATDTSTTLQATWTNSYDLQGRVVETDSPDAGKTTTSYWPTGETKTTTDAVGRTVYTAYDALGRPLDKRVNNATGTRLASWTYDDTATYGTIGIGKQATATSYNDSHTYTEAPTGFDNAGRSLGTKLTLNETGLNPTYTTSQTWTSTGLLASSTFGATTTSVAGYTGGVPAETVDYYYDDAGNPQTMEGANAYLSDATYTPYGEPAQYVYDSNDQTTVMTYTRDAKTRRVTQALLTGQLAAPQLEKTNYSYDATGNPTKIVDQEGNASTGPVQTTCYAYDNLRQLTNAWSSTDSCATNPAVTNTNAKVGGQQPYWTTWTYDDAGNRTSQVQHGLGTATSTTTNYTNGTPDTDTIPEHALASTTTTGATTGSSSYTYNADGSTASKTVGTGTAAKTTSFSYGPDGQVDTVATPTGASEYVQDADGNTLIRRDTGTNAKTTLYLDGQEVSVNPTTTGTSPKVVNTDRYYTVDGTTIAERTNRGAAQFLFADLNGTSQIAVNTDTWAVTRRYLDPYGNLLANKSGAAAPGTLPGSHGFLNKPENKITGLDELGARLYDPTTGRFTSVDPVLSGTDPTAENGYTYSGNNPVAFNDASGEMFADHGPSAPTGPVYGPFFHPASPPAAPAVPSYDPPKRTFTQGFGAGAKTAALDYIDSFNPVSIAKNIKRLITSPPPIKSLFHAVLDSFTHLSDFKAAYETWKSGDDYGFGKAVGKLAVELSGDLASTLLGGGKAVSALGRALKGASAAEKVTKEASIASDVAEATTCALRSFAATTLVVMADGHLKPISQVHVGDKVKTRDPATGKTTVHTVTNTWVHSDVLTTATFTATKHQGQASGKHGRGSDPSASRGGDASSARVVQVVTTEDHPYWNATDRQFEELQQFDVGDQVSSEHPAGLGYAGLDAGTAHTAIAYNLTVSGAHTYLVGPDEVLVHNCGRANCSCADDLVDYSRPSGYRAGVRDKVWDGAVEESTGRVRDPLTGRFMSKTDPWDMGHVPGHEFRRHAVDAESRGITRKEFLDEHNDPSSYRPELPSSNRSHKGELLD